MILGVDVSTSITGLAIVADGSIVYYDSVDLRKYKNVFEKGTVLKEKIVDLEQRVILLESRNQITDKVTEITNVRPY